MRLSLSAEVTGDYLVNNVNTVTQFLVLYNEEPSDWHFVQVTDVTKVACNATNKTTTVTIFAHDETAAPLEETISIMYSNDAALVDPPMEVTTNASGLAEVTLTWDDTADTNSTQVWFENDNVPNGVGAGANLLFKGATMMDLYGGYIT
ncbi:MAG: hypothetical protein GWN18_20965, partial [Thermoplasmata archaeon]|nr:hypothetical protein [Thermoplasmata archaeon]NIS14622.1 hypothetical protein [Thermoplasmata archaeon]NIS22440.1 hypothetical protein [Thermoplasmata archaeon]NIT80369.1 hypothetical protein [Thermoplasmata archaeon]NIU51454.1 hypothetical protein [Thermoplasmata archaeon]